MIKIPTLIVLSSFVLTACSHESQVGAPGTSPTVTLSPIPNNFSLVEVARHGGRDDCWLVVEGKVYDVTPFVESGKHPGGEAILEGCGKDATELFNTRPMGSKTPHSDKARESIKNFEIGTLAP
jgi:cytochrome b involved in lipid metabolism